jgi:hypothetical protein
VVWLEKIIINKIFTLALTPMLLVVVVVVRALLGSNLIMTANDTSHNVLFVFNAHFLFHLLHPKYDAAGWSE